MKAFGIPFNINDICNLRCPFCYLENMPRVETSTSMIDKMLNMGPHTYVCIGKEPTLSPELLAHFLKEGLRRGVRTGFITNGTLLGRFFSTYPNVRVDNIDITYHAGDDVHWKEQAVNKSVAITKEHCGSMGVLFVLHKGTEHLLADAIRFAEEIGATYCMVSPMTPTHRAVPYDATLAFPELDELYHMLARSEDYMRSNITRTVVDDYHFLQAGIRPWAVTKVEQHVAKYGLKEKVIAIGDPFCLPQPVIDVDITGAHVVAVHPLARLNTEKGVSDKFPSIVCDGRDAESVYKEMLKEMEQVDSFTALHGG